jgi:16S rRNA (uracil1498-N3)-methyltransferase
VTLVLVPPGVASPGASVPLDEVEQHHLKVRRVATGTQVQFTDGAGLRGTGTLVARGREVSLDIRSVDAVPPAVPLVLAVGAGDRDRFGWLVEKATELGVTQVIPLETERTRGVATGVRPEQLDKLRRRAREVLKQCGGAWVPVLHEPQSLETFLQHAEGGARWLLDADGGAPPVIDPALPAYALVGPEGGLSDSERAAALAHRFTPVSAGPLTLRFETAALAAAVLIQASRRA